MKMRRSRLCSERVASAWRWARTCRIAPTVCHCDRQAWGEFGDQRKSLLWCFQLLGHRRACVGAVQNIFMRNTLWLGRVGTGATARAWVRRVSRNLRPSCAFGRRWTWRGGLRRAETPRRARCHLKAQKWQHYVYLLETCDCRKHWHFPFERYVTANINYRYKWYLNTTFS